MIALGSGRSTTAIVVVIFISLGVNLLMLASPIFMLQVFDRVLPTGNTNTLVVLIVMAFAAILVLGLLDEVRSRILIQLGAWWEKSISPLVLAGSVSLASERANIGAQPLRDVATVRQFIGGPALIPLMDAPWVPIFVLIVYLIHPWLGHVALAGAVMLFALALANERLTVKRQNQSSAAAALSMRFAESAIQNADAISSMSLLPAFVNRWKRGADDALDANSKVAGISGALTATSKALRLALQVAVLGVGALLVISQDLTAGGMIASSIIMSRALAPVEQSLNSWRSFIGARSAYDRVAAVLKQSAPLQERTSLPTPQGLLTAERLAYIPSGSTKPIVANVSFQVPPGGSLGIIGPSGSGKSTISRLIVAAIRPTAGKMRLDGADLQDWPTDERGTHFGYMPQDVQLFDATISENIGRLEAKHDTAVVEAAKTTGAHDMILSLPGGYDAVVRDNGRTLSGGQRQRIGLARAFYGSPQVIVLDEPSASLDADGERQVVNAIQTAKERGTTIVLIDHKPRMMQLVDYVMVMREGQIFKFGPKDEILKESGQPAAMKAPPNSKLAGKPKITTSGTAQITSRSEAGND